MPCRSLAAHNRFSETRNAPRARFGRSDASRSAGIWVWGSCGGVSNAVRPSSALTPIVMDMDTICRRAAREFVFMRGACRTYRNPAHPHPASRALYAFGARWRLAAARRGFVSYSALLAGPNPCFRLFHHVKERSSFLPWGGAVSPRTGGQCRLPPRGRLSGLPSQGFFPNACLCRGAGRPELPARPRGAASS